MPGGRHGLLDSQNPALASFPSDKFFSPFRNSNSAQSGSYWQDYQTLASFIHKHVRHVSNHFNTSHMSHPSLDLFYGSLVKNQESCIFQNPLATQPFCMVNNQEISIIVLTVAIIIVTIIVESEEACYVRTSTEKVVTGS